MVYVNITFLCGQSETAERLQMLKNETIPELITDSVCEWKLMELVDVLGNPDFNEQDRSFPLQFAFIDEAKRAEWINKTMMPALGAYSARYGENGLVMVSLLNDVAISPR